MKFSPLRNDGHGSSHSPVTKEQILQFPTGQYVFENLHSLESHKVDDFGKRKLQTNWTHYVMLQDKEVYRFHTSMNCEIEDEDIPATEDQCYDIVNISHEDLISGWEKHRQQEVNFFPSLSSLPNEQIPLFVSHLMKTLNDESDQLNAIE